MKLLALKEMNLNYPVLALLLRYSSSVHPGNRISILQVMSKMYCSGDSKVKAEISIWEYLQQERINPYL